MREAAESTKLRIVYDASARAHSEAPSLNDCLNAGPPLQNRLWDVLVRMRFHPVALTGDLQGEDRKKWPPMKIGFLDYNCVKRAENVEKFINRTVQLPNMTEGLTLLNLKCNFHHTNR